MQALRASFSAIGSNLPLRRLIQEDEGVEGCGLFHKNPAKTLHVLGNILRIILSLAFAPIYLFMPRTVFTAIDNYVQAGWLVEYATTPDAVLSNARSGEQAQYDVTGSPPSWVLKVSVKDGALHSYQQLPFSEEVELAGYTALSYPMYAAHRLFTEAGFVPEPAPKDRPYTLLDRKRIAEQLLRQYCSASRREGNFNDRTEFIWLDEFCLSDDNIQNDFTTDRQRNTELGRLADIFRGAVQVVVFCHEENCRHTGLSCIWGQRLFTIPEILHAQAVSRLTRKRKGDDLITHLIPTTARAFREEMQTNAALGNKWHLAAIFQHTVNAGAVPWQVAIHALVVEAIRRDNTGGFQDHKYLGRALNGLLPRRARLQDLGSSGWNDLAWLLELNQGFYNAASLAAVCSVADVDSVSWLGTPIDPAAGNERLEPVVTAFPIGAAPSLPKKHKGSLDVIPKTEPCPPLSIIAGEILGLRPKPLKRDADGLYTNEEMKGLKILSYCIAFVLVVISTAMLPTNPTRGLVLYYVTAILFCIVELLVSTMYLDREGWVFLADSEWGDKLEEKLGEQDNNLRSLTHWGHRQLIPKWEAPGRRTWIPGKLVDLRSKVYVETITTSKPNAMVPLAIHGSGVTCMLLERPEDSDNKEPTVTARKVGMCNVPPYIFAQTTKSGTICVGSDSEFPLPTK